MRRNGPQDTNIYAEAKARIEQVIVSLRARIPECAYDLRQASFSEVRTCHFQDRPAKRVVIILRGSGCQWARKAGGCAMCGHIAAQASTPIAPESFIQQFATEYGKYDFRQYPVLCLYNNGSFLNDTEMPPAARSGIFGTITSDPHIREVVLETRADTVSREKLKQVREQLRGKNVVIAMGLESKNDEIRDLCVHKGILLEDFEKAARMVRELLDLRVYVLLKPPFLAEKEAIDDAVESIKYAHSLGASVHIECCTIQDYTVVSYLAERALYRPPWLWSIIEVLRETAPIPVYVTPFKYIPLPKDVPRNCTSCSQVVSKTILKRYNRSFDRDAFTELRCSCKKEWQAEMEKQEKRPFPERVLRMLASFSDDTGGERD